MNLISLYYFVELARELHMTNTAQRLYITQQNLSQHIQRLEQYYGVTLFHRKPKLALTYAGEQLYASAVRILAEEHDLANRLSSISEMKTGNLKVGIPAYRAQISLPDILPMFYEKWPNVMISLISETSNKMEDMLFNGDMDLFIGIMEQNKPHLNVTTLLNGRIYLVCSDRLLQRAFPDTWEALKAESSENVDLSLFYNVPFLLPNGSMKFRKTLDQCFQTAKITPKIFLESQSTELFMSLYPYDYGAFFCTQMRLPSLLKMFPDANAFPLSFADTARHRLVLAYHEERLLPEYAHDFIRCTKEVYAQISEVRKRREGVSH